MGQTKEKIYKYLHVFMNMYILKLVRSWIDLIDTFHLVKSFLWCIFENLSLFVIFQLIKNGFSYMQHGGLLIKISDHLI